MLEHALADDAVGAHAKKIAMVRERELERERAKAHRYRAQQQQRKRDAAKRKAARREQGLDDSSTGSSSDEEEKLSDGGDKLPRGRPELVASGPTALPSSSSDAACATPPRESRLPRSIAAAAAICFASSPCCRSRLLLARGGLIRSRRDRGSLPRSD